MRKKTCPIDSFIFLTGKLERVESPIIFQGEKEKGGKDKKVDIFFCVILFPLRSQSAWHSAPKNVNVSRDFLFILATENILNALLR